MFAIFPYFLCIIKKTTQYFQALTASHERTFAVCVQSSLQGTGAATQRRDRHLRPCEPRRAVSPAVPHSWLGAVIVTGLSASLTHYTTLTLPAQVHWWPLLMCVMGTVDGEWCRVMAVGEWCAVMRIAMGCLWARCFVLINSLQQTRALYHWSSFIDTCVFYHWSSIDPPSNTGCTSLSSTWESGCGSQQCLLW